MEREPAVIPEQGSSTGVGVPRVPRALSLRLALLALVLTVEGLRSFANVGPERGSLARWALAFTATFLILGYPGFRARVLALPGKIVVPPVSWGFVALHACMMATLSAVSKTLEHQASGPLSWLLIAVWFCTGIAGICFLGVALIPARVWLDLFRETGKLWVIAFMAAGLVWMAVPSLWVMWNQPRWIIATNLTFWLVRQILHPILPAMQEDMSQHLIGSDRFTVIIDGTCSGWEGLVLILVFSIAWLWVSRRQYRFPQALALIPASMLLIFLLNSVRIAALILIGHAGAPVIAMTGFHSQAGWIGFNMVAFGITLIAPRVFWLTGKVQAGVVEDTASNSTIPYLLPFAVILASGMVSRAASAGFEWLYPLRFFAALGVLWVYRRKYLELKWKPGWLSPIAGIVVFLIWIAVDRGTHANNGIAMGLAALPGPVRIGWLVFRCLAAVVTVPIAEELAFRGYLLRRFISSDFESVDFHRFTWPALLGSSLAFGVMHGDRWLAGTLAGLLYAIIMLRRGSIGSAVVAHATTNALIASTVLAGGKWYLW